MREPCEFRCLVKQVNLNMQVYLHFFFSFFEENDFQPMVSALDNNSFIIKPRHKSILGEN